MAWEGVGSGAQLDWSSWIKGLGKQARRVREFVGLSQEQVARTAGVSQGAVSRFEGGRGLATPLLVVMKVNSALRSAVSIMDRDLLSEDARELLLMDAKVPGGSDGGPPITKNPELEELVRLYHDLPERQRQRLLAVVRATATALGASSLGELDEQRAARERLSDAG
jgi:transcriptional regulator with XRE-family HTH domain